MASSAGASSAGVPGAQIKKGFTLDQLNDISNNFTADGILGSGDFGTVYKGVLKSELGEKEVAIRKVDDARSTTEFHMEILVLMRVRHDRIIEMIGYCAEGEGRYVVYEHMAGGSLETNLHGPVAADRPLDWLTRIRIAQDVASALTALHHHPNVIVYANLKPSNILLDEGNRAKLSDFGFSVFGSPYQHAMPEVMSGNHAYASPEFLRHGRLSWASDVYSYGILLLELITGQKAHNLDRLDGEKYIKDWALNKTVCEIADIKLGANFSKDDFEKVMVIVEKCLNEEPDERPTMVAAFHGIARLAKLKRGDM